MYLPSVTHWQGNRKKIERVVTCCCGHTGRFSRVVYSLSQLIASMDSSVELHRARSSFRLQLTMLISSPGFCVVVASCVSVSGKIEKHRMHVCTLMLCTRYLALLGRRSIQPSPLISLAAMGEWQALRLQPFFSLIPILFASPESCLRAVGTFLAQGPDPRDLAVLAWCPQTSLWRCRRAVISWSIGRSQVPTRAMSLVAVGLLVVRLARPMASLRKLMASTQRVVVASKLGVGEMRSEWRSISSESLRLHGQKTTSDTQKKLRGVLGNE